MTRELDPLAPYRIRTVRIGVQTTWLVLLVLAGLPFMPHGGDIERAPFLLVVGAAAAGVTIVGLLPWRRMFERGLGVPAMYAWSVFDIVLITVLLGITGPDSVEVFGLYGLTTLFFAASYPPRGQVLLLGFTCASYLTLLALGGWTVPAGSLFARLGVLGVMTFLASFLSRELMRQVRAHRAAQEESARRATLLRTLAEAARGMSHLDSDRVLAAVVDSALRLGFEAGNFCFYDESTNSYRVAHARGLPAEYAESVRSASTGIVSLVLATGETVIVDDYAGHPLAVPQIREAGFRSVVGTPVWSKGELAAILFVGSRQPTEVSPQIREAVELLAAQAGRALENARRFEDERRNVNRLAELDRLKQDFLSMVSHEIRTPLTVIEGMGVTLESRWDQLADPIKLEFLRQLNANARTLEGIIEKLLDFSRLEAGRLDVSVTPTPMPELIDHVLSRLSDLLRDHRVVIEAEPGLRVIADPMLMDRILENLLSNAAKYTPPGTGVLLQAHRDGPDAVVAVSDDGPGIPPDELTRIGERFFRGGDPNARAAKGIGLGLALVREILDLHGSRLEIRSTVGEGTRFSFRLPLVDADLPPAPGPVRPLRRRNPAA